MVIKGVFKLGILPSRRPARTIPPVLDDLVDSFDAGKRKKGARINERSSICYTAPPR
jgi:hypothetical protein